MDDVNEAVESSGVELRKQYGSSSQIQYRIWAEMYHGGAQVH